MFADAGVPAVSFGRMVSNSFGPFHCRYDVIEHLSRKRLAEFTEFILSFTKNMAHAHVIPVSHTIPANIKEELDEEMGRESQKPAR